MSYQEVREKRINCFEDTIRLCEREPYLLQRIEDTRKRTVIWTDSSVQIMDLDNKRYETICEFELLEARSLSVAKKIKEKNPGERVGILNIASAWNPGGSVIRGEDGQEEELCRCTTLYPCLDTEILERNYYAKNRVAQDNKDVEHCLYVPDVVCLQEENPWSVRLDKDEWFFIDVIHCPMSNPLVGGKCKNKLRENVISDSGIEKGNNPPEQWLRRALSLAAKQKIDVLVLGKLGEDTLLIENILKTALQEYAHSFRAVYYCS